MLSSAAKQSEDKANNVANYSNTGVSSGTYADRRNSGAGLRYACVDLFEDLSPILSISYPL